MTAPVIRCVAGETGWAAVADDNGWLRQLAVGPHAGDAELAFPAQLYPLAIPTFGTLDVGRAGLRITHADGTRSTRLAFDGVEHTEPGTTRIVLVDPDCGVRVSQMVRTHPHGILEMFRTIENTEAGSITVWSYDSASLSFACVDPHLLHLGGGWARETWPHHVAVGEGRLVFDCRDGVRNLDAPPTIALAVDGPVREERGAVLLGHLAANGRTSIVVERRGAVVRLGVGWNDEAAEVELRPGATLTTPSWWWSWSETGVGAASRRFHHFVNHEVLRGDVERRRPIVANNWEATFFDFDTARLCSLADDAADLGAEVFLLDDGWFGDDFPRDDDTAGLGDWEIDRRKLPDGLNPVIDRVRERGMRFGLWFEPEMVNPRSRRGDSQPDWIVGDASRSWQREHRQQLALDMANPDVVDFASGVFDRWLDELDIAFVKWDANRPLLDDGPMRDPGSGDADVGGPGGLSIARLRGIEEVARRIAERHPDVDLMLCASGGGRGDLSLLRYAHEHWASDNTDAFERLPIQFGASLVLPAAAVAAHVTRMGDRPLAVSAAVALCGRFGWDLDTSRLTDGERATIRRASQLAVRHGLLVQRGEQYRLRTSTTTDEPGWAVQFGNGGDVSARPVSQAVIVAVAGLDDRRPASPLAPRALGADIVYDVVRHRLDGDAVICGRASGGELVDRGLDGWLELGRHGPEAAIWELSADA